MHSATLLFVLVTTLGASALRVLVPGENQGWASTGSNTLSWERVSTDPTNFTVILTNTDRSVLPENNQVLVDFVDATAGSSISVEAPSGGFNVGGSYRVNLVKSETEVSTIYAQSDEFDITAGSSSATDSTVSAGTTSSTASASTTPGSTTGTATRTTGSTDSTATTATDAAASSDLNPASSTNAATSRKAEFGLLGALLFLGGFLA